MNQFDLEDLRKMIDAGDEHIFYCMHPWRTLRAYVLKLDRYECQRCKENGRYKRAVVVHHVKHLKDRPDLALSVFDPETGDRQLISLCKQCHELEHPERLKENERCARDPVTVERWD